MEKEARVPLAYCPKCSRKIFDAEFARETFSPDHIRVCCPSKECNFSAIVRKCEAQYRGRGVAQIA